MAHGVAADPAAAAPGAKYSVAYKRYVLSILTLTLIFNSMERLSLGLMLQDIKAEFQLSDTQLGVLGGIAFALFYSVMGVPIARWADRSNRVTIITVVTVLWSITVGLCGAVGNFVQLLLVRVGVAVGEAGSLPLSFSLIADYFDRAERPRAVAIYGGVGGTISATVGYFAGGWLVELYGWRKTFLFLALPGFVLAALAWFTLKEPRLIKPVLSGSTAGATTDASVVQPSLKEVCNTLWSNKAFRNLLMCLSVLIFFNFGIGQWTATYFIRQFSLTTGQIGSGFALVYGIGGLAGAYLGGELSSRYAAQNERLQLEGTVFAIVTAGVLTACVYLIPAMNLALGVSGLTMLALSAVNSPLFATMQSLVPQNMRAVAFALAYLVANFVGMGLGPLAAGALSDALRPWAGEQSLRYALLALSPGYAWAAWHAWRASVTVARDLAQVDKKHHS